MKKEKKKNHLSPVFTADNVNNLNYFAKKVRIDMNVPAYKSQKIKNINEMKQQGLTSDDILDLTADR